MDVSHRALEIARRAPAPRPAARSTSASASAAPRRRSSTATSASQASTRRRSSRSSSTSIRPARAFERVAVRVRPAGHRCDHDAERRVQRALRGPARRARSGTATTGSSGRATEFEAWATAVGRALRLRRSLPAGRARTTRASARRRRWGSSRAMKTDRFPELVAGRARSARRAPASRPSRDSTSSRRRSCRRTSAAAWSRTTRTTRRRRTTRSRCCTSSPRKRLAAGRLTVVDATNVQPEARKPLVALAREYHCLPVAIVLRPAGAALPGSQHAAGRTATSAPHVVRQQSQQLRRSLRGLSARASGTSSSSSRRRRSKRP